MTNWCEGTLKVRGKAEDIKRFVLQGMRECGPTEKEPVRPFIDECGDFRANNSVWIEGTSRGYIEKLEAPLYEAVSNHTNIICVNIIFAWDVKAEELLEICKKYHVDMRAYVFESGLEFNQDIEIIDGRITKDEVIKFDDYEWDCIFPELGG